MFSSMMSHICIPTPLAAQPGRQRDYRFCARIRKHEPLLSNLASRRCSRKTYFVAGPHRMSERPQPIARTVRRTPRNRSRPMRCEHTLQTGCNLPPRGHLKSRSSGEGGFQERLSYVRPRGRKYIRRWVDKATNEVRHFYENRQTRRDIDKSGRRSCWATPTPSLEGRVVTPRGRRGSRRGIRGLSRGFPG